MNNQTGDEIKEGDVVETKNGIFTAPKTGIYEIRKTCKYNDGLETNSIALVEMEIVFVSQTWFQKFKDWIFK